MGEVDDEVKFKRYLYFLTENQHYVVTKKENVFNNKIDSLLNLLAADKINKIIEIIEEASKFDWLPNRNVLFHVLALCAKTSDNPSVKSTSYSCAARLIKNIEDLIQFITYERALQKNASSGLRRVIKLWYMGQDTDALFDAIVNVRSVHGWSHKDILKQSHIKAKDEDKRVLLAYASKGLEHAKKQSTEKTKELISKLEAVDTWRYCKDENKAVELAGKPETRFKSTPGALLRSAPLWTTLIPHMTLDQLIEELSRFHRLGMFKLNQPALQSVVEALGDAQKCRNSSLQPATVLLHMKLFERPRPTDPKLREYLNNLAKNKQKEGDAEPTPQIEKVEKPVFSRSHAVTAALGRLLHHSLRNIKPVPMPKRPKTVMLTIEVRGGGSGEGVEGLLRPCFGNSPVRYGEVAALLVLILQRLVSDKHLLLSVFNGPDITPVPLEASKETKDQDAKVKTEPEEKEQKVKKSKDVKVKVEDSKEVPKGGKDVKKTGKEKGGKDQKDQQKNVTLTLAQVLQRLRETGAQSKPGAVPVRPLRYALESKKPVDVFINVLVTGDSAGRVVKTERHKEDAGLPADHLIKYRQKLKIANARMLNIALCGRNLENFCQTVPTCPGLLNVVGFNPIIPALINSFINAPMI